MTRLVRRPRRGAILLAVLATVAAAALVAGCGDTVEHVVYRDYPVEYDEQDDLNDVVGDPELQLGVFSEQLFRGLNEGDEIAIVHGFQGGTWVHLSIRAFGVLADGEIDAKLGDIGQIRFPLRLTRSAEGFLEAYDLPIPVNPADGNLDQFYGQTVELSVRFVAGETTIEKSIHVVLVSGS